MCKSLKIWFEQLFKTYFWLKRPCSSSFSLLRYLFFPSCLFMLCVSTSQKHTHFYKMLVNDSNVSPHQLCHNLIQYGVSNFWRIILAPIHSGANQIRARCCTTFWLKICRYQSGEQNLVHFPPVRIKKCPLMQSGSSFTTVDDAFDKGICQKQEKPSSKLTFSKFEISKIFLNSKMILFCNCNSQQ